MKVIFLDIDGVLNSAEWDRHVQSFSYGARFNSCYLLSQEMILRLQDAVFQTNAEIVLTSSWRASERAMDALKRQLSLYHLSIRDTTVIYAYGNRADEVKLWIESHPNVTSYVIVDDEDDGFTQNEVLATHFVQTTYTHGLTCDKAVELIEILNM